jgi:hypothetical protein
MTQSPEPTELETALVAVYRGPLEEFVSRRDALVKQLRAAKRREDADRVKALRKPSRTAWILDSVVHDDPMVVEQLSDAITAAQTVHSGADLRATLDSVRAAIRDVAAAGARVAIRAGHPIDASALVTAVHAVIGETSAFGDLRAGRLVDVPDGGGLDILSAITINVPASPPVAPSSRSAAAPARADLERAEAALADVREQSERAERSVRETQTKLDAAERVFANAQAAVQAWRAEVEGARRDAEAAAAQVRDAERRVAAARSRLRSTSTTDDTPDD